MEIPSSEILLEFWCGRLLVKLSRFKFRCSVLLARLLELLGLGALRRNFVNFVDKF